MLLLSGVFEYRNVYKYGTTLKIMTQQIKLWSEAQFKKMSEQRTQLKTYGRVVVVDTKKINRALNVLEAVIPMTFFLLSVLGWVMVKVLGERELLRIEIRENGTN
jgi:hypothetical protein